jgi:hypothetical protein
MNNKNILLFSFLFIINTNAMSPGKKLEQTKKAWFDCKKRPVHGLEWIFSFDCSAQQQAYYDAKQEIVNPLNAIIEEGIKANQELREISQSLGETIFPNKDKKRRLERKKLLAYAASGFVESLTIRDGFKFESSYYDNKTMNDFCNDAIETFVVSNCLLSTYASEMMGPIVVTEEQLEETKRIMREIMLYQFQ